jgi:hypothetical protein
MHEQHAMKKKEKKGVQSIWVTEDENRRDEENAGVSKSENERVREEAQEGGG